MSEKPTAQMSETEIERERELRDLLGEIRREVIAYIKTAYNYDLSLSEAVQIKRIAREVVTYIQNIRDENKKSNKQQEIGICDYYSEIIYRFLVERYGINPFDFEEARPGHRKAISLKEFFQLIKEKYRPETEKI